MNRQGIAEQPPLMTDAAFAEASQNPAASDPRAGHTFLRRTVLLAVIYAFPACLAITAITLGVGSANPDLWWHLGTGRWIAQHHAVPHTDPFSAFGMDKPWVAYSWLYDLTIYGFYHGLGLIGPAVCVILLATAIGIILYRAIRTRMRGFAASIALTSVGLVTIMRFFSAMPVLVSVLLFLIEMDILFRELVDDPANSSPRRLWLLPALFVLWANVHVEFVYGLAVLVFAALVQNLTLFQGLRGTRLVTMPKERRYRLWFVTLASFVATLVNPYSWRIYGVILGYARDRAPFNLVTELRAPNFRSPLDYVLIFIVLFAAFVLGRLRFRGNLFAGLLLAGTTVVSFRAAHDEWAVLVVALLIIAEGCSASRSPEVAVSRRQRILAAFLALLLLFAWAKQRDLSDARLEADAAAYFPVKAADFVLQQGLRGPLFNDFNWGGYLIWRLPGLPVSMDGRTNVHGGPRAERSTRTWSCMPGWKADPDLAAADLVIGSTAMPLSYALEDDPRYQLVYRDAAAVVFVRRTN
jgi:hypothetical protein